MRNTISIRLRRALVLAVVGLLRLSTRRASKRFFAMLDRPEHAQDRLLGKLLDKAGANRIRAASGFARQ